MPFVEMALFVLVLPALVAGVVAGVGRLVATRTRIAAGAPASVALALGAAVLAARLGTAPLPRQFPPIDVTDWIPVIVLVAMLLGLCESLRPSPAWARWENRVLLALLVLRLILGPLPDVDWTTRANLTWLAGLLVASLAAWANVDALAARRPTAPLGASLVITIASTALALLLSGTLVLAQIGAALAAALGAVYLVSWRLPAGSLAPGGTPVLVATCSALLIEGHVYAGLAPAAAVLLASAPFGAWLGSAGPARRLAPWQATLLGLVASLVPAGVAVGLVLAASPGDYE
jgi:hypothetical protein